MASDRKVAVLLNIYQAMFPFIVGDVLQIVLIPKFEYVSNCALSSGAICLKILQFDCLSLCHVVFFLRHVDIEKLRYRAKSDSTFVVSVEK